MIKKSIFVLLIVLTVMCACNQPEMNTPKTIKGISNYSKYESIGIGQEAISSRSITIKNVMVGLSDSVIEKVVFYDENMNQIKDDYSISSWSETEKFLFFEVCFPNITFNCCLYKLTGEVFVLDGGLTYFKDMANDMKADFGDVLYLNSKRLEYSNGKLTIESFVSDRASRLFTFYFVDRFGTVFSTCDAEYKGKLVSKDGRLKSFNVDEYFKGRNGIVYFRDKNGKGYFDSNADMVYVTADDFFPSSYLFNYESSHNRWYTPIIYENANDQYFVFKDPYGTAGFSLYIEHIHFNELHPLEYTSEVFNIPTASGWNESVLRYYELIGKYLYILRDSGFFRIDITNANVDVISNNYPKYEKCDYIGDDTFRLTVLDEFQNIVRIAVDLDGNETELSKEKSSFESVTLFPIAVI